MRMPVFFITCLLYTICCNTLAQAPAQKPIMLENKFVRFEFDTGSKGLCAIIDKKTNINHIKQAETYSLWKVNLQSDKEKFSLSNLSNLQSNSKITNFPDGKTEAAFLWNDVNLPSGQGTCSIKVTITLPPDSGIASWQIYVNNDSNKWGLWDVEFPRLIGFLESNKYDVAAANYSWGRLTKNSNERISRPYCGTFPMQFICANIGNSGVYMAAHDKNAWQKRFVFQPGIEYRLITPAENMGIAGTDFNAPYPAMLGVFQGNWLTGCKIYRKFALTAPWVSEGKLSQRTSVPQRLKDNTLWFKVYDYIANIDMLKTDEAKAEFAKRNLSIDQRNELVIKLKNYLDVPIGVHWYTWHEIPFDVEYPNYFPTKPGIAEQMKKLVAEDILVMPYINGRIIDRALTDFNDYLPYCTKDTASHPYTKKYAVVSAVMCPYTKFWQDKVAGIVEQMAENLGINAIYLDQISASKPILCFDKTHGHPVGGGTWWREGYYQMLQKIRNVAHSRGRDMPITSEWSNEIYIDQIDAFLNWPLPDPYAIPMLAAVYSDYTTYFGAVADLDTSDQSWITMQGRDFLWGNQNGWNDLNIMQPKHKNKLAFLKKIGKWRVASQQYLTYGELVDVIYSSQTATDMWPQWRKPPMKGTVAVMQGAVWKSENNSLGIFLANFLNEKKDFEFTIDPEKYGLSSKQYKLTRVDINGQLQEKPGFYSFPAKITLAEPMQPRDIKLLEITPIN